MEMEQPIFKKGEWCFCQFILQQVQETEGNCITSVSDGHFNLSSRDLSDSCFPLDMRVKTISDSVEYYSKQFHAVKPSALNYPDLNRALIDRWAEMCINRHDDKKLGELYKQLENFGRAVLQKANDIKYETVDDVRIFK